MGAFSLIVVINLLNRVIMIEGGENPQSLSDEQLLGRLRDFGDTSYKAVTTKNRLILEKKLNHFVARQRKLDREAEEKAKGRKSPKRGRPSSSRSVAQVALSAQGGSEFSDSDIDRSPSRNRRSTRRQSAAVNTSYGLDETRDTNYKSPGNHNTLSTGNRSRRSFGANTSFTLDETTFEVPDSSSVRYRDPRSALNSSIRDAPSRLDLRTPPGFDQDLAHEKSNVYVETAETGQISVRGRKIQSGRMSRITNTDVESSGDVALKVPSVAGLRPTSKPSAKNSATTSNYQYKKPSADPKVVSPPPKTSRKSSLLSRAMTVGFVTTILLSIGVAIYYNKRCVGDHCATFVKIEDRLKIMAKAAANVNGDYQCGNNDSPFLRLADMNFDDDPKAVVKYALENHKDALSFKVFDEKSNPIYSVEDANKADRIQSSVPLKSILCRIRQSFTAVTQALLYLAMGVFGLIGLIIAARVYVKERQREEQMVNKLVEAIIEMVKLQAHKNPPYMPIAHVRDTLLSAREHQKGGVAGRNKRWEKAVLKLGLSESRLRTENQIIQGEEHLVWRWVSMDYYASGAGQSPKMVSKTTSCSTTTTTSSVCDHSPVQDRVHTAVMTSGSEAESLASTVNASAPHSRSPYRQSRPMSRDEHPHRSALDSSLSQGRVRSRSNSRGRSIKLGPGSGWSSFERSSVEIIPPTRCLKLKDLALECTGNAGLDAAKQSVIDRLHKYSYQVYSVDYDHRSEESAVYICCMDKAQAAEIYRLFYEQKYNGEKVQVKFLKLEKYLERFPYLKSVVPAYL